MSNSKLVFIATLLILCSSLVQAQAVGEKAKLSNVVLFDGSTWDPKSIEGSPTLVYFWASWCPFCRREMPQIEKHYQSFKDKGFKVVAINFRDKPENARRMIEEVKPITYPVGTISDAWRSDYPDLKGTPTWLLLDREGTIRKVIIGHEVITGGWFDGLKGDLQKLMPEK